MAGKYDTCRKKRVGTCDSWPGRELPAEKNEKTIKVLYSNVRSISGKINELKAVVVKHGLMMQLITLF